MPNAALVALRARLVRMHGMLADSIGAAVGDAAMANRARQDFEQALAEYDALATRLRTAGGALAGEARDGEVLRKGIKAVAALIDESHGVAGLHLNGDVAPWDSLLEGGRFEEWLRDFSAARAATEGKDHA